MSRETIVELVQEISESDAADFDSDGEEYLEMLQGWFDKLEAAVEDMDGSAIGSWVQQTHDSLDGERPEEFDPEVFNTIVESAQKLVEDLPNTFSAGMRF